MLIPFDAVVGFADPSVNFGLQFKPAIGDELTDAMDPQYLDPADDIPDHTSDDDSGQPAEDDDQDSGDQKTGEVVALDAFRKKKI